MTNQLLTHGPAVLRAPLHHLQVWKLKICCSMAQCQQFLLSNGTRALGRTLHCQDGLGSIQQPVLDGQKARDDEDER